MIITPETAAENEYSGGKAQSLGKLNAAYYNVPPFFVVINGEIPEPKEIEIAAAKIGCGPYAVRSSALQEDGVEHSHAGQYESILNVDAANLTDAIKKVMASGENEGLIKYRQERGLDGQSSPPAIIIQQMINADKAGVAFSANPVSGNRRQIVISATNGLADKLVSGEIDGTEYWLSKPHHIVEKSEGNAELLSQSEIIKIAALAQQIENHNNHPQDIEWAIKGDVLYLLQARPITSKLRSDLIVDDGIAVFDNSNIIESYPSLVSPLTFSFASYAYNRVYTSFVGLLGVSPRKIAENRTVFENMLARLHGRVYYNLGNWYRALALLPGYKLNSSYMETMMGVGEPLPEPLASQITGKDAVGLARIGEYLKLIVVGGGLLREAITLRFKAVNFRKRLNRALDATTPSRLEKMSLTELAGEYRNIEAELLDNWDAPIINDFFCMIAFGASRKLMEKYLGDEGLEIHNDVLIGQGDIISARPAQLIREMGANAAGNAALIAALKSGDVAEINSSNIAQNIKDYINEFGDRCTEELKLESVTLDENPIPLYNAIIAAAQNPNREVIIRNNPFKRIETALDGQKIKTLIAKLTLNIAKNRVRDRENLRYERTRIFGRARRLFLAIGNQFYASDLLDDARDIFYLTVQEILGAIEGNAISNNLKALVIIRKTELNAQEQIPDPPERVIVHGALANIGGFEPIAINQDNAAERYGTACSSGVVTAVARVIKNPFKESINAGEILVARNTDPGWIALFASASAIIVERGSLLSHSAIVSRELGIPCVVGLKDAIDWIKDGEIITVDGASGLVTKANGSDNEH